MDKIDDWIQRITGFDVEIQNKIYLSIIIIIVL